MEQPKRTKPKKVRQYINNKEFSDALMEWKARRILDKTARMTEYIGECFLKLVENYSKRNNFSGYTYLDVMKTEAIYHCVRYAHNYDAEKGNNNAFGYFSKYIENAFVQIIKKEKAIAEGKFEYIKEHCKVTEGYDYKHFFSDEE